MARKKTIEFQTHDVTNEGRRGRPSHPVARELRRELILSGSGVELGEVELEAQENGSVILTAVVDGRKKSFTFSAKAKVAKAKPRKARAKKAA